MATFLIEPKASRFLRLFARRQNKSVVPFTLRLYSGCTRQRLHLLRCSRKSGLRRLQRGIQTMRAVRRKRKNSAYEPISSSQNGTQKYMNSLPQTTNFVNVLICKQYVKYTRSEHHLGVDIPAPAFPYRGRTVSRRRDSGGGRPDSGCIPPARPGGRRRAKSSARGRAPHSGRSPCSGRRRGTCRRRGGTRNSGAAGRTAA